LGNTSVPLRKEAISLRKNQLGLLGKTKVNPKEPVSSQKKKKMRPLKAQKKGNVHKKSGVS